MQTLTVTTADQFPIAVTVFGADHTGPLVLINGGTGISQRFYGGLAQYLAQRGCTVATYDYRGIGASRVGPIAGHRGTMKDWAQQDMQAVVDWLVQRFPHRPLTGVGHSFGGQAFALHGGNRHFSRVAMVGAQSGYWRLFEGFGRWRLFALWHVLGPALVGWLQYFPSRRIGLGEDLPPGVMRQWAAWGRHPQYLMSEFGRGETNRFDELQGPILMLEISDDSFAPAKGVAALRAHVPAQRVVARRLDAKAVSARGVGHFGFFREAHRDTLWRPLAEFLEGADVASVVFPAAAPTAENTQACQTPNPALRKSMPTSTSRATASL